VLHNGTAVPDPADKAAVSAVLQLAQQWLFADHKAAGLAEAAAERVFLVFNRTDFDGYAVKWGIGHNATTAEDCAAKCLAFQPVAPSWYPCNTFVFCGTEPTCFAPAAHTFTFGQCWLKHQDDPLVPQINMQGVYDEAYKRRHPEAPAFVQWTSGVVVRKELAGQVGNGTASARAGWH